MNEIKTVFGFTVRSAVRKKPFKVTTIVLLALILILCALPSLLSSDAETPPEETPADEKSYACYYIDPKGLIPGGRETLAALLPDAEVLDGDIARLDEYGLECDDNGATLVVEVVEREGAPFIQLYQGALSNPVGVVDALKERWVAALLAENGVSEDVIALTAAGLGSASLPLGTMRFSGFAASIVVLMVMFFAIYFYGYSVASSVASEKSSRVMETLVVSAKPRNILAGKLLGTAFVGFAQLAVCALFAVACYTLLVPEGFTVAGMPLSFETFTPLNALLILLLFVFGFFLYALLYSITGAMVSRTEDLGSAMAPVMTVNFVAFYSAYFIALIGDGGLKDVFSLIPFTAPFVLPFRLLNESVAWHVPVLALLLLAAAFALIAYATMKIYSASVLYYGQRLKIRDLIKIKL